jgi:hypothetical protein
MSGKVKLLAFLAGAALPCLLAVAAHSDEVFTRQRVIQVPGGLNSFDIGFVDSNISLYVLADRTNKSVDTVDTSSTTSLTVSNQFHAVPPFEGACATPAVSNTATVRPSDVCTNRSGPNGVIIVDQREIWAADAPTVSAITCHEETLTPAQPPFTAQQVCSATVGNSSLKVLDAFTGATLHVIDNGGKRRADELCEDVRGENVLVANDDPEDNFLTFVSTESYRILKKIKLDGTDPNGDIDLTPSPGRGAKVAADGIEQCKFNPRTGNYYLAIPATKVTKGATTTAGPGVVLVISREHFRVENTITIDPATGCTGPQGLAIGPDHEILLGCGQPSPNSLIINEHQHGLATSANSKVLANSGEADEVWYNPGDNQYFIAQTNQKPLGQLGVVDPSGQIDAPAATATGSHSVAADMLTNQVYVPGNRSATTLCGSANGCIAVFTAANDDPCLAHGMPVLDHDDGDDPVFMRTQCGSRHHDDDGHVADR